MRLEVLVGMIASGKSTYARRRADEGAMVVCHDDLTEMLHARYRYEPENREFYRRIEEAVAYQALLDGKDVVIDRTHLTRESRRRWIEWIGCRVAIRDVSIVAVTFPIEPAYSHAMRRYNHDPRGRRFDEWLRVALHHEEQAMAEPLSADEGFAEIIDAIEKSGATA